ncbi:MAG: restriction endonuclease subunit S [Woeseia sp.]
MKTKNKRTLTPKLRFPEFRDEPEWEEKSVNAISDVNPNHEGLPDSFFYIDLESVEQGELVAQKVIKREEAPSRAQRLLRNRDVIYQTVRPYQRNNFFFSIEDGCDYVASTGYAQLRAHDSPAFLFQLLHTNQFVNRVLAKCTGSNYPAINSSDLAAIEVAVPSPAEQQKIADCLGSLDGLIAAEGRKLAALRDHKRGLMQQLFPQPGQTQPRLRFPEFMDKGEWKNRTLGDCGEIVTGKTPSTRDTDLWGGELLFITPTDISEEHKYQHRTQRKVAETKSTRVLPAGSIIYTCIASVGKMAITVHASTTNQQINSIIPKPSICNEFIYYSLEHLTPWIKSIPSSSTLPIINKSEFSKICVMVPLDPSEQQKIAACLITLDTKIAAQAAKIDSIKAYKRGLMQQLFPSLEEQ